MGDNMTEFYDKPCAASGLLSYRYKTLGGFIMIGAADNADAISEANRSLGSKKASPNNLEKWNGERYLPAFSPLWHLTREEYFNDIDRVRADAIAAGCIGKPYQKLVGKGKKLRCVTKNATLDNGELFEFGKQYWRETVTAAIVRGEDVSDTVRKDLREWAVVDIVMARHKTA